METMVYRKSVNNAWAKDLQMSNAADRTSAAGKLGAARETSPLSPKLFYPLVSEQEMVTWTYWLPTAITFDRVNGLSPFDVVSTLTRLDAPPEVLEEFHWSWKMELFETYEVRTPVRRDLRDPVLLGRLGSQCYRIALWGESLRPLGEITELVQHSLEIRARATRWHRWLMVAGTLLGLGLGVGLGSQPDIEGRPLDMGLLCALLGLFFTWLPSFLYTPENRQHSFLDRYRC
jgi:hypothetical protein